MLADFTRRLLEKTEAVTIGDPVDRRNWLGPVINQKAVERYTQAVGEARQDGRVLIGGERATEDGLDRGFFVAPTVGGELSADHRLFRDELFLPFTAIAAVDSIDEALRLSNATHLGLTAGFYSEDPAECQRFLDEIEAGVVYVNRPEPRPGPGRASSRSAAGKARPRRVNRAAASTTSSSSCASRARPSSTSSGAVAPARGLPPIRGGDGSATRGGPDGPLASRGEATPPGTAGPMTCPRPGPAPAPGAHRPSARLPVSIHSA